MQRAAIQCSLVCVKSAVELIETLYKHNTSAGTWGQKPTWLYAVLRMSSLYKSWTPADLSVDVYLAATVLLAARLAPSLLLTEIPAGQVQMAWDHALDILQGFQADSRSAQKCIAALQLLYHKLPATSGEGRQQEDCTNYALWDTEPLAQAGTLAPASVVQDGHTFFDDAVGNFDLTDDTAGWFEGIDFADPYDMSWFLALDVDAA